ncbi:MAG: type II toxin-antitoxin system mRNA interferase toxin, RelE/StbE family [Halobacteriovoraceae bacterium]|nr:type II toxin-antitoxin system mRNA interferase toxin, RelE/StbE family [Halobacteriovoraceae bacterium]|tara:strand:- start:3000 stop:3287 length:288 start_codon:yes stop_codon:yes gene_type:complete
MWKVLETKDVRKNLKKIPVDIRRKYKAWIAAVQNGGSENLVNFPGFKDKALKGKLRECRASRLNFQYRVVYTEDKLVKEIIVVSVTAHKYEEIKR